MDNVVGDKAACRVGASTVLALSSTLHDLSSHAPFLTTSC